MRYFRRQHQHRLAQRQLDLPVVSQPASLGQNPQWSALPDQTQRTLSGLLTGLLIAHAGGGCDQLDEPPEVDSNECWQDRSDRQQLVEMCRVVDTLLVDQEVVYPRRQGNDCAATIRTVTALIVALHIIKNELLTVPAIDIYIAVPSDLEWNGLAIHGSAGLELGLIKKYVLPWNMRSAR
jgi:hypothetical protein